MTTILETLGLGQGVILTMAMVIICGKIRRKHEKCPIKCCLLYSTKMASKTFSINNKCISIVRASKWSLKTPDYLFAISQ